MQQSTETPSIEKDIEATATVDYDSNASRKLCFLGVIMTRNKVERKVVGVKRDVTS